MADNNYPNPQDPYNNNLPYPNQPQNQGYNPVMSPYDQPSSQIVDPYATVPNNQSFNPYPNTDPTNQPPYPTDPYSQAPMPDPYGANVNNQSYDPYSQAPMQDPYSNTPVGGFGPNDPSYNYNPEQQFNPSSTFQERKAGNKIFLFIIIAVIIVLVGAAGVLIYLNLQNSNGLNSSNTNNSNNQNTNPPIDENLQAEPNISKTGGPNSPATLSRKSSNVNIPITWSLQKFQGQPFIDATGKCLDTTKCGPDADPDGDGVSNIEEFNFNTDPQNSDTDRDGIADGDELYVYYTNPTVKDSDNDGYNDFDEVSNCYDPTDPNSVKMVKNSSGVLDLSRIEANVELNPLKPITQSSFVKFKATNEDIAKGYVASRCVPPVVVEDETTGEDATGENSSDIEENPVSTSTSTSTTSDAVTEQRI